MGIPVTLKVDPKGYILYWRDQHKVGEIPYSLFLLPSSLLLVFPVSPTCFCAPLCKLLASKMLQ